MVIITIYLISYDLNKPEQDYPKIIEAIKSYGTYCQALKSQWFIRSEKTAVEIGKHLMEYLDENDEILICEFNDNHEGLLKNRVISWLEKAS